VVLRGRRRLTTRGLRQSLQTGTSFDRVARGGGCGSGWVCGWVVMMMGGEGCGRGRWPWVLVVEVGMDDAVRQTYATFHASALRGLLSSHHQLTQGTRTHARTHARTNAHTHCRSYCEPECGDCHLLCYLEYLL
jgi:hypothetical protein